MHEYNESPLWLLYHPNLSPPQLQMLANCNIQQSVFAEWTPFMTKAAEAEHSMSMHNVIIVWTMRTLQSSTSMHQQKTNVFCLPHDDNTLDDAVAS